VRRRPKVGSTPSAAAPTYGGRDHRETSTGLEPKRVAEEVLRAIEGPYRMRRPVGQAALLSWPAQVAAARLFEPSLRKAYGLDASSKGAGTTAARRTTMSHCRAIGLSSS